MTAPWKLELHGVNVYRTPEACAHPASTRASVTATAFMASAPCRSLVSRRPSRAHPTSAPPRCRLAHPLKPHVSILAAGRGVGPADDLPFLGLVGEPVADLELHRQYTCRAGGRGLSRRWQRQLPASVSLRLLLGTGLSHRRRLSRRHHAIVSHHGAP